MNILTTIILTNSICFGVSPQEIPLADLKPFNPIVVEHLQTPLTSPNEMVVGYSVRALNIDWACSWRNNYE